MSLLFFGSCNFRKQVDTTTAVLDGTDVSCAYLFAIDESITLHDLSMNFFIECSSRPNGSRNFISISTGQTLSPISLRGACCPGTMHSGPAASANASIASPSPIGSGCFMMARA